MRKGYILLMSCVSFLLEEGSVVAQQYPDSADWKVWKLNTNSTFNDFSPLIYRKGIIFSSDRENDFGIVHYDRSTKKQLLDVYYSETLDSFRLSSPTGLSRLINTPFHDGPASVAPDGSVYFTSNGRTRQKKNLNIYYCEMKDGDWLEAKPLNLNSNSYSIAHPAFSRDGNTLYFASDMPGGLGGTDLYQSQRTADGWGTPKNLGPEINTSGNERFPFIDPNGILYFASDGWEGVGKLDIFSARKRTGTYEVLNMGYPFNSAADDFGFTCDSLVCKGYFSSNRSGSDDNVYGFYRLHPVFLNCEPVKKNNYCFTFYEENSMMAQDTAGMVYQWDYGDGSTSSGLETDHCFTRAGDYFVQLNIIDSRTGRLFFNQASYEFKVENIQQLYIDVFDTVGTGQQVRFDASGSKLPGFDILKYYWLLPGVDHRSGELAIVTFPETGSYEVKLAAMAKDQKTGELKEFCTTKKIDVVSEKQLASFRNKVPYTPGGDNHKIDTVLNIIPSHDSITYKVHLGSSKTRIPANSKLFAGLSDVREIKDGDVYRYTTGEAKKLFESLPFYKAAREKGFDAAVVAFENNRLINNQQSGLKGVIPEKGGTATVAANTNTKRTNTGTDAQVQAYTILFKTNQYLLSDKASSLLDSLSGRLKDNQLKVDILAHTDNTGNPEYNLLLSRQRAESIAARFVSKGIAPGRIKVIPLGETSPLTENKTESGKQSNRRADILIHK